MVHDWAVTENFVIFPIIPLTASLDRLKAGGPIYVWDGSQDVYLGVASRRGSTVRWFRGANRFASHIMNAYDDGRYIHIDTPVGEKSAFPWFPDITGRRSTRRRSARTCRGGRSTRRRRPIFGEGSTAFGQARLTDCSGEFPRTDDRWAGRGYRYGVMNLTSVPGERPDDGLPGFRWLASIDPTSGTMRTRFAGRDSTVQEAIFVPPPGVDSRTARGTCCSWWTGTRPAPPTC